MRRIWKFILPAGLPAPTVPMPADASVLHAHEQDGQACVWAAVDPAAVREQRRFAVVLTGGEALTDSRYVGTCHLTDAWGNPEVVHVYDLEGVSA